MAQNKWSLLFVTSSATGLVFLESTVMPVALPTIGKELLFSQTGLVWVVNIYLLTLLTLMLLGGRLCDLWGLRRSYGWGLILFFMGSVLAGLGFSKGWLLGGRFLQGVGGALSIPATGALIIEAFPPGMRAKAIGINTGIGSLFLVIGPVVGGFLTEYLNWRWIFWINLPVIVFVFVMSQRLIPYTQKKEEGFHFLGAFPLALGVIALVTALMQGGDWGWTSPWILGLFASAGVFFLLFAWISRKTEHPIIDFSIFKSLLFPSATFCIFITQCMLMVTVFWAIYFQQILQFSPGKSGFLILVATVPVLIMAPTAGFWADRVGPRLPILTGFILLGFSFFWFALLPFSQTIFHLLPGLLCFGCGIPMILSPSFATALSEIPPKKLGTASALVTTIRQLASTIGIALMSAIFYGVGEKQGYHAGFSAISFLAAFLALFGLTFAIIYIKEKRAPKQ